jgi:hypothetical protein
MRAGPRLARYAETMRRLGEQSGVSVSKHYGDSGEIHGCVSIAGRIVTARQDRMLLINFRALLNTRDLRRTEFGGG